MKEFGVGTPHLDIHRSYKSKKSYLGPSMRGLVENISPGKRFIIVHAGP